MLQQKSRFFIQKSRWVQHIFFNSLQNIFLIFKQLDIFRNAASNTVPLNKFPAGVVREEI